MPEHQQTTREGANPRTRTITTVLMIVLVFMIVRDIFVRRRNRLRGRSRRDISLVVR
jgi:hypothetical protein